MQTPQTLNDKTRFCPAMVRVEYETTLYVPKAPSVVLRKKKMGSDQKVVVGITKLNPREVIPMNMLMMEQIRPRVLTPSTNCCLVTSRNKPCMQNKQQDKATNTWYSVQGT